MSSEKLKRKVAKAEGRLDEIGTAQQAIQDRIESLKLREKTLAYPAHQQGEKQAQVELTKIDAEIQKLEPEYEANDQKIAELSEQLVEFQEDLNLALIDDVIVERDRAQVVALEKWLEADDLRQQSQSARVEFDKLRQEVEQLNSQIRSMGGHAPGFQLSLLGSDESIRAEAENRIQALRGSLKAAA